MNKKLAVTTVIATALAAALFAVVQPPRTINCTGTATAPQVYDLGGVEYKSLVINGQYCHVKNFVVRGSVSHGVRVGNWAYPPGTAHHIEVSDFAIYDSTTEGLDGIGSWGSCLKAETNSHDIYFHDGSITRCGGEAVGITGADNVLIERVTVTDGKMAGFYIDNSLNVTLRDVSVSCGKDTLYWRNGKPSASYLLGDERYAQLGGVSKLGGISITGATSYGCGALVYWGGQVEPNGVNGLYVEGVFWDAWNKHDIRPGERNANIDTSRIVYNPSGATVTPTPATPTRTPTRTPAPATPTVVKTTTPTPTVTPTPSANCIPAFTVWVCDRKP